MGELEEELVTIFKQCSADVLLTKSLVLKIFVKRYHDIYFYLIHFEYYLINGNVLIILFHTFIFFNSNTETLLSHCA